MHIDGLRRRRLALLKKKRTDLRFLMARPKQSIPQSSDDGLKEEEGLLNREIGVLECARKDLI